MEWTQIVLYIAVGLLVGVVLCWVANLILLMRKKSSSMILSRVMYWAAIAAVVLNAVRSAVVYPDKTMLIACLIVLVCIIVSLVRLEKHYKYGDPEEEQEDQP